MANDHVKTIETKIVALRRQIDVLAKAAAFEELIKIIHHPGWTTPAEFTLVTQSLDMMATLVDTANRLKSGVLEASTQIIAKR